MMLFGMGRESQYCLEVQLGGLERVVSAVCD